jgi:hypothetical protein
VERDRLIPWIALVHVRSYIRRNKIAAVTRPEYSAERRTQ